MSVREFFESIIKHNRLIALFVAVAILLCSFGISVTNSNTASVVIKYLGETAIEGKGENGNHINPYEISSSTVVKNAALELGLENINTEEIRKNIKISPIVSTAEKEKYASWIENFSNYDDNEDKRKSPIYYEVTFSTDESAEFAKDMLNAIIDQYRLYYVENYTHESSVTKLSGEIAEQYDYYETVDLLRRKINSNVTYLNNITSGDVDYRSHKTGYSMSDLVAEYEALSQTDVAVANRMVLETGAAKDADKLIKTLQNKIVNAEYDSDLNIEKADSEYELMKLYSKKNKEYLWNNTRYQDDESDQVREEVERDNRYVKNKSTYDTLMLDYVQFRTNSENYLIDKTCYESDIQSFGKNNASEAEIAQIEERIGVACEKFNELYEKTKLTIEDYNKFKSSRSVGAVSGVWVTDSINSVFYYGVSVVMALVASVTVCIFLDLFAKKK